MVDFTSINISNSDDLANYIYNFYSTMEMGKVKLVYEGEITHQITKALTALAESQMISDDESTVTQKKVFHVLVECLQNISKHGESIDINNDKRLGKGVFLVIKNDKKYNVISGNVISKNKIQALSELIDVINKSNKESLKEMYKTQIKEGRISEKGGAGLGLIDMARKSGNKLEYRFIEINPDYSFFVISTTISREN